MSTPHSDLRAAVDASPADWVLDAARAGDAATVMRYGPPGFDAYLRLPFGGNVPFDRGPDVMRPMETALQVLGAHTGTPDVA